MKIDFPHFKKFNSNNLKLMYWLKWAAISFAISIIGGLLISKNNPITFYSVKWKLTWVELTIMIGILLALGEWVVLPIKFSGAIWWIIAGAVGSLFGFVVAYYFKAFEFTVYFLFLIVGVLGDPNLLTSSHPLFRFVFPMGDGLVFGTIYGFFIASLQTLVLVNLKRLPPVRWWITINMITFAVIGILRGFFLGVMDVDDQTLAITAGGLLGLLLLGYLLLLFLHRNISQLQKISAFSGRSGFLAIMVGVSYAIWIPTFHPNVDLIFTPPKLQEDRWLVSPNGDKVVYQGIGSHTYLKIIPANRLYMLDETGDVCNFVEWLDDVNLYCVNSNQDPYILVTDDLTSLPLEKHRFIKVETAGLIEKADKIYRLVDDVSPETLVLVSLTQNEYRVIKGYVIENVENAEDLLQEHNSILVAKQSVVDLVEWNKLIYSPNHLYYCRLNNPKSRDRSAISLAIFDAKSNRKLSEYATYAIGFRVQWASDNSGVFFQPIGRSWWWRSARKLRKLNIPTRY